MGLRSSKRIFPVDDIDVEKSKVQSQRRHFHWQPISPLAHTLSSSLNLSLYFTNTHTPPRHLSLSLSILLTHTPLHSNSYSLSFSLFLLTHTLLHALAHALCLSPTLNLSRIFKSSLLFKTLSLTLNQLFFSVRIVYAGCTAISLPRTRTPTRFATNRHTH